MQGDKLHKDIAAHYLIKEAIDGFNERNWVYDEITENLSFRHGKPVAIDLPDECFVFVKKPLQHEKYIKLLDDGVPQNFIDMIYYPR